MAIRDYFCPSCNRQEPDVYQPIRLVGLVCPSCNHPMKQIFYPPTIFGPFRWMRWRKPDQLISCPGKPAHSRTHEQATDRI